MCENHNQEHIYHQLLTTLCFFCSAETPLEVAEGAILSSDSAWIDRELAMTAATVAALDARANAVAGLGRADAERMYGALLEEKSRLERGALRVWQ